MTALLNWAEISAYFTESVLVLGNGASRAIWEKYAYGSLYERAAQTHGGLLTDEDRAVFDHLKTSDFEEVLRALNVAMTVNTAFQRDITKEQAHHERIRRALIDAVTKIHIAHAQIPESTLQTVAAAMRFHLSVYTTNYDLIAYWSLMKDKDHFYDYFGGGLFDVRFTEPYPDRTRLLYLHGAAHLYRDADGATRKDIADQTGNLLQKLTDDARAEPVFVSEGSSEQKTRAIRRNDYLSFVLSQLGSESGPAVLFGLSLSDNDAHIAQALNTGDRDVAISMRPAAPATLVERQATYQKALSNLHPIYFDAETHPLGAPGLRVAVP